MKDKGPGRPYRSRDFNFICFFSLNDLKNQDLKQIWQNVTDVKIQMMEQGFSLCYLLGVSVVLKFHTERRHDHVYE